MALTALLRNLPLVLDQKLSRWRARGLLAHRDGVARPLQVPLPGRRLEVTQHSS